MVFIDEKTKEINCKIVYYGPGLCGRTSNINYIYQQTAPAFRGELKQFSTQTERWLNLDICPDEFGKIDGYKIKFQLQAVPGAVFYEACQVKLFKDVDGIIFIADSQFERLDGNLESRWNMQKLLDDHNYQFENIPSVLQFNKRDLKSIFSVESMKKELWIKDEPIIEAIAYKGIGVFESFHSVAKQLLTKTEIYD